MIETRRIIVCDGCEDTWVLSSYVCGRDYLYDSDKERGWTKQGKLFLCPECSKKWNSIKPNE